MSIQIYCCPHCGHSLEINESKMIRFCPMCGQKISSDRPTDSTVRNHSGTIKQFVTDEGVVLGTAFVPENYVPSGIYEALWRSEMVPIYYSFKLSRNDHRVFMSHYSKELFHDIKNPFLKGMLKMSDAHVKNGYQKFIDPHDYLVEQARNIAKGDIRLTATAKLPSPLGRNPALARQLLENDIEAFASFVEINPKRVSTYVDSLLYRFESSLDGKDVVIFVGMDYEGAELAYTNPVFSGIVSKIKDRKHAESFGHSNKHVDHILFGPQNLYYCMCYKEEEEEAQQVFIRFIGSIAPDKSLDERAQKMLEAKFAKVAAQIARNQMITRQNLRNLQYNQQRLSQTLRDNANSISDGIMDSWNRKMDSDSRISDAYSQATMGVDSYTNRYGQNIDVSVTADHVYQNQYGDVYGVSGNEPDQDLLNDLNWTKLNK